MYAVLFTKYSNNTVSILFLAYLTYRIAGFLREDFNIALGTVRNIKIRIVFVNAVICWSRDILCRVHVE